MEQTPRREIHWFWKSTRLFYSELQSLLPAGSCLNRVDELEIRARLLKYLGALARRGKDFKELVAFRAHGLVEIRFTLTFAEGASQQARLLLVDRGNWVAILLWHVKNPFQGADEQRREQNQACHRALERLKGLGIDTTNCG
jgi:hypothetical protein